MCLAFGAFLLSTGSAQVADHFDQAGPIGWGNGVSVPIDFSQATIEIGEAADLDEQGSLTVWGTWTPEEAGTYVLSTDAEAWTIGISVYVGDARNHLTPLGNASLGDREALYRRVVDVNAGVRHFVRFELAPDAFPGTVHVSLEKRRRGSNEAYSSATQLVMIDDTVSARGRYLGEALWWRWTVPETDAYELLRDDSGAVVAIGTAVASEAKFHNRVRRGQSGHVLLLESGEELAIKLSTTLPDTEVALSLRPVDYPQATFTTLETPIDLGSGESVSIPRTILNRSRRSSVFNEAGFRNHWKWTPTFTGLAEINIDYWSGQSRSLAMVQWKGTSFRSFGALDQDIEADPYFEVTNGEEVTIQLSDDLARLPGAVAFTLRPASPPSNDAFESAAELGVTDTTSRYLIQETSATSEPGEAIHGRAKDGTAAHSRWWTWSPRTTGIFTISASKRQVSVYRGDALSQLEAIAAGRDTISFTADANNLYRIATATDEPFAGGRLRITQRDRTNVPEPPNASWETAIDLGNDRAVSFSGRPGIGRPAWWEWVAPETGVARLVRAAPADLLRREPFRVHEFRDGELQTLSEGSGAVPFLARAGVRYFFEMIGEGDSLQADVRILTSDFAVNNTRETAEPLSETPFSTTSQFLTSQAMPTDELWWRWQPKEAGFYDIRVVGAAGAIDILDSEDRSTPLFPSTYLPQLGGHFQASPDETYHVRLQAPSPFHSFVSLQLRRLPLQPHADERDEAIDLGSGETVRYETSFAGATPSEAPNDHDDIWFRWTAPNGGLLDIDVESSPSKTIWRGEIDAAELEHAHRPLYVQEGHQYLIRVGHRTDRPDARVTELQLDLREQQSVYENWVETIYLGLGGPEEDPDEDGINNLLELALGGNPISRLVSKEDRVAWPRIEHGPDGPVFRCHVSETIGFGAEPISVHLETSSDLRTWERTALDPGEVAIPLPAGTSNYYRLRVALP